MIRTIHIRNYALISQIDIDFSDGLNIITGETGAGKSIILGALSLILGGRADAKAIGDDNRKSVIEAEFKLEDPGRFSAFFDDKDLDQDGDTCILRREITPNGRSRAFINDSPVSLATLRELAIQLIDIHSQHQNMLLADPDFQLKIIDSLADNEILLRDYRKAYYDYQTILKKYASTRDMIRRGRDDADFISYQLEQLDELDLQPGEQTELEHDRDMLSEMASTKENLTEAIEQLSGEDNAVSAIERSIDAIRELSDSIDEADVLAQRLESVIVEVKDIADALEKHNAGYKADPNQLVEIEERLGKLYSLELKHHVDSSDELIALRDKLAEQLATIENGDAVLAELEGEARKAKKAAMLIARKISEARHKQAALFADELLATAGSLGMKNLRCEISVTTGKLNPSGIDTVDFLFSFNKNQSLMPVGGSASGGEISRLMLSIKSIVGEKMHLPSIIFDEVDTGVSGDIAGCMGEMMKRLSERIQVITITHLPQVAAKGRTHFKVYKEDDECTTTTRIRKLDESGRIAELAVMLGGSSANDAAMANARALLGK